MEVNIILEKKDNGVLINESIEFESILVINHDGQQLGIMSSHDALKIAYEQGFDLVVMAAQAMPPVCKIMDYGKYRFEREKRAKEAKKNQLVIETKEIQLSPRIDVHDLEIKANQSCKFLKNGNKVRIVMRFRGREMNYIDGGMDILQNFANLCSENGAIEKKPALDGHNIIMILAPMR